VVSFSIPPHFIKVKMACPVPIGTSILKKSCVPPRDDKEWDVAMAKFKKGLAKDPMYLKRVKISALAYVESSSLQDL
jgi:hypothetical protein